MIRNLAFYLGAGALFTHELDAMTNHEWRVLPLTAWLPEEIGRTAFVALHVPLFAALIALLASRDERVRRRSMFALGAFLVVHAGLHAAFSGHPHHEFSSALSLALIYGGALCGVVHLVSELYGGASARDFPT